MEGFHSEILGLFTAAILTWQKYNANPSRKKQKNEKEEKGTHTRPPCHGTGFNSISGSSFVRPLRFDIAARMGLRNVQAISPILESEHRLRRGQHKCNSCFICSMCPGDSNLPLEDFDKPNRAADCKSSRNLDIDHCRGCGDIRCTKGLACCQPCTTWMGNCSKQN